MHQFSVSGGSTVSVQTAAAAFGPAVGPTDPAIQWAPWTFQFRAGAQFFVQTAAAAFGPAAGPTDPAVQWAPCTFPADKADHLHPCTAQIRVRAVHRTR